MLKNKPQKIPGKHLISLCKDMVQVLLLHPFWLAASIISTVLSVAFEPSLAWIGKTFVDQLKLRETVLNATLMNDVLIFTGVLMGLGILKFGDKILNKIYDLRLMIGLQRTYLQRQKQNLGGEDISRLLYDCDQAKQGMDILYKDAWKIVTGTISVVVWQLNLAPEWLPALLFAVLPPILVVFFFGRFVQKISQELLNLQSKIASSTSDNQKLELFAYQESFFKQTIRLEFVKKGAEVIIDLLTWVGLLLLILLAFIFDFGLLPRQIEAGDIALFAVNLNFLSKPIGDIGKVYNKGREAYPALLRVLQPQTKP
ncbi:MAG: ABC transporter ATP-binding protein [Nodularia sp. CChRGM 3473]